MLYAWLAFTLCLPFLKYSVTTLMTANCRSAGVIPMQDLRGCDESGMVAARVDDAHPY